MIRLLMIGRKSAFLAKVARILASRNFGCVSHGGVRVKAMQGMVMKGFLMMYELQAGIKPVPGKGA